MLLQNLLQHMKGKGVLVNGHVYKISSDLVVRDDAGKPLDIPEADAQKLLGNPKAWAVYNPNAAPKIVARAVEVPRIQLVTSTGDVIPPPPKSTDQTKPDLGAGAVMAAQDAFEAKKQGDLPPPPPVEKKDPPIPKDGEEWADPSPEHSMEWLQACAKAYRIRYKGKDKSVLVEKIKAAMYG